jgi:manganese transport protein
VLRGISKKRLLARILPFLGPAFVASIAYLDPGNFATNIQGGAKFGYLLLWVIVAANLMAMLVQSLSAKLGIATGLNLAEHCRLHFPKWVSVVMWILMELVAMATDLAEFVGAALGFYLLFNIPLLAAGLITAALTFVILSLERYGFRPIEAVITAFVGVIAFCYLIELFMGKPNWPEVFRHMLIPEFRGTESILLATGILGATIMPHVIFLHSSLTQGRIVTKKPAELRRLFRYEVIDVVLAMGTAGLINLAMLIMASSTFFKQGITAVGTIEEAHRTLAPILGGASSIVFAIALLASGLASSTVGTMAGQVIMQGFIRKQISPLIRRSVTILPSLAVIALGLDPTRTLVISQVVLSFGLPFAVIPLVLFTAQKKIMGTLTNKPPTTIIASLIAGVIISLNIFLLYQAMTG